MLDKAPINEILKADSLKMLRRLPNECVDTVITSPPYYQQRDYGAGIGNEKTVLEYVNALTEVFVECLRVTKEHGNIIFNVGDKYKEGNLMLIPYQFALRAQQQENVKLINTITWVKSNPTPRQYRRRLVSSTEPFFHFVQNDHYYYDISQWKEKRETVLPPADTKKGAMYFDIISKGSDLTGAEKAHAKAELEMAIADYKSGEISDFRMKIRGVHAQAFGGQSGGRNNEIERNGFTIIRMQGDSLKKDVIESAVANTLDNPHPAVYPLPIIEKLILLTTREEGIVLDPFIGSGTTAIAAQTHNRRYLGIDINQAYCYFARKRIEKHRKEIACEA